MLLSLAGLPGCAVVAVADAAATAVVKTTGAAVGVVYDVSKAGVKAVVGSDDQDKKK